MVNLIIFVVVSYIVYRLVIVRIRWRLVRILLYVPILTAVVGGISLAVAIEDANRIPSSSDIASLIVDQATVERGDLRVTIGATGAIQPIRQVPLAFASTGKVAEILATVGQGVTHGDIIARLDTTDFEQALRDVTLLLEIRQNALEALLAPPRDVDIAVAEAALEAAQAQYYAASATAPTSQQQQIAQLQVQLAMARNWQLQLQRDALVVPTTTSLNIPSLPPIDVSGVSGLTPEVLDAVNQANTFIGELNGSIDGLSSLSSQSVAGIEAQRRSLESSLDDAETSIAIAQANADSVTNRGADTGALGSARLGIIQAEIALNRLLNGATDLQLQQANTDVALAELSVEQARYNVTQGDLVAPFDGIISQNNLTVGELPPQGIAVLLMDTSGYVVDLPVDETDVVKIREGQTVLFSVDALPNETLRGVVTRIAYTPVRIGQLVTYTVRVKLDETALPVRVGMSVTANIVIEERQNTLYLRNRFIRFDSITQDAFVTIQQSDGTFREVMVILGERNDTVSEILGGLEFGQAVVLLPRGTEGVQGIFR